MSEIAVRTNARIFIDCVGYITLDAEAVALLGKPKYLRVHKRGGFLILKKSSSGLEMVSRPDGSMVSKYKIPSIAREFTYYASVANNSLYIDMR
jgi:hypothetical protein